MAKKFKMPENLDINYKFFGGKLGFKDIGLKLSGLLLAIPEGLIIFLITQNTIWAVSMAIITTIIGAIIGSKKLFNKTVQVYVAIYWDYLLSKKSKVLLNKRTNGIKMEENINE